MRAVVVALADLGRSARMQYHARALSASGVEVALVGYEGTALSRAIEEDPRITVHRFKPSTLRLRTRSAVRYAMLATIDTLRVSWRLRRRLRPLRGASLVIVQNPPAFPTFAVAFS